MPVVELDGRPYGRGPAADELQTALRGGRLPSTIRSADGTGSSRSTYRSSIGIQISSQVARASSPSRATPRASRTSRGASTQTRRSYASRNIRCSAQTPSIDHDARRLHRALLREGPLQHPVEAVEACPLGPPERFDDLALETAQLELLPVPELVGADDLRVRDQLRERRLSRRAAATDPDEQEGARLAQGGDPLEHRSGLHSA